MKTNLLTQLFRSRLVLGHMVRAGLIALLALLLVGLPAQAANYILSDSSTNLPPGVTIVSPGHYSGGVLTLGAGDTISLGATKPATLTFPARSPRA